MEIRKFGPQNKTLIPQPGVKGFQGAVIQLPIDFANRFSAEELSQRYQGRPILLDYPTSVVALYFEEQAEMEEHSAPHPILFMVIGGKGFVRIGGPTAPNTPVEAGDAILWPEQVLHKTWTETEPMQAIVIEYPPKNPS